jgi:uncharacterized protein (TIGR02453 family)
MRFDGFGPGALRFYDELAENNERSWWHANKDRYESEIRAPLEYLLADLTDEFGEGKVFRPNRDTRFSADKSPYKTAAAAVVNGPEGTIATLYMQLSATGLMVGGGCYHPARDQLARLRAAIADERTGTEVERIIAGIERDGGGPGHGDKLKTAPRGYAADHPRIELLRMKGLVALFDHPPAPWLHHAKARDQVAENWRSLGPLNAWLDRHVGPSTEPPDLRGRGR